MHENVHGVHCGGVIMRAHAGMHGGMEHNPNQPSKGQLLCRDNPCPHARVLQGDQALHGSAGS